MQSGDAEIRPRVLVVDDDADSLLLASVLMNHAGFSVSISMSSREAMEIARALQPALVLL